MLGEIKTTTSANHNICGLINKSLAAYRIFKLKPLAIILYPDIKPISLQKKHQDIIEGLSQEKIITQNEYQILNESFFLLTQIGWRGGLQKRTDAIQESITEDIQTLIEENKLLQNNDINYSEWDRLINYIRSDI